MKKKGMPVNLLGEEDFDHFEGILLGAGRKKIILEKIKVERPNGLLVLWEMFSGRCR